MQNGIVSRQPSAIFRYQAWPTVCRDEEGTLYVGCSGFRLGHVCPLGKNLLYVSRDGGKSFGEERAIGLPCASWDVGYPSTVELADGSLYTVYYQRLEGDDFPSILYTKWRIEELT